MAPKAEKQVMEIRENLPLVKSGLWPWLPHLLVVFWLIYLGITIWQHALHSVQPPLYDPLGYMQKAMNFWQAVEHGKFINPLNLEPMSRPPGTILMSYPFGFSPDFHGFHFRSVFLPILCMVAAVYTAAGTTLVRANRWWVAAIALLCSSLPMFYQLDWVEGIVGPTRWGLVDNFQSGIAALAAAALVRSLVARSQPWLIFCALMASFTLLIKPSGTMIMALIALIWIMVNVIEWLWASRSQPLDASLRSYVFKGAACLLFIYIIVIALCLFSGYLSRSNFAYARQALTVMREVLKMPFKQTLLLFHQSSGEALLLWVIGVGVLFVYRFLAARESNELLSVRALVLLVGSLSIWCLGAWYWLIIQAGGNQIRYFYPFMLMGVVCMIPAALYMWPRANHLIRTILMALCFLSALNIAGLMAAGDNPSNSWQKMTGVSVSIGRDREEVRQAYTFLGGLRKMNKNVQMYSFSDGVVSSIFENVGMYEEILRPELPVFHLTVPMDWARGFAVRVNELMDSDYILIKKHGNHDGRVLSDTKQIDSFEAERMIFEIWLSTLNEQSGIEIASEGPVLSLFRIVDRNAFKRAIDAFVSAHVWRPEFVAANQLTLRKTDTVSAHAENLVAKEIDFGGIYKLHALSVNRVANGIKIDVQWEELRHEEQNNQRFLFLHLVDSAGTILHNQQIALHPYNPPFEDRRWRHGEVTFPLQFPDAKVAKLAFGVYHSNGSYLLPDKGATDWEGRRILLAVTALTGATPPTLPPEKLN